MNNWRKTAWILQQVLSSYNLKDNNNSDLIATTLECTLSWLRIGHLPLDTIYPLYPYFLMAAAHYIPNR